MSARPDTETDEDFDAKVARTSAWVRRPIAVLLFPIIPFFALRAALKAFCTDFRLEWNIEVGSARHIWRGKR